MDGRRGRGRDGRERPERDERDATAPRSSGPAKRCSNCGARIDSGDWFPLVSYTDADGVYRIESFCGDDCRREWLTARPDLSDRAD